VAGHLQGNQNVTGRGSFHPRSSHRPWRPWGRLPSLATFTRRANGRTRRRSHEEGTARDSGCRDARVPRAQALYYEAPLQTGATYTFRIGDGTFGTQLTLLSITRGRLELEDSRLVPPGTAVDVPFTVPARATRIVLVLDLKCSTTTCGDATLTVLDLNSAPIAPTVTSHGDHFEVGFDVTQ
jgi:hypothetical protein